MIIKALFINIPRNKSILFGYKLKGSLNIKDRNMIPVLGIKKHEASVAARRFVCSGKHRKLHGIAARYPVYASSLMEFIRYSSKPPPRLTEHISPFSFSKRLMPDSENA